MSADLDRLLSDAAATPTRPVDVHALHARAQRSRRRDRLVAGMCAVVLLAVGTAAALAVTGGNRVELGPADAPAGAATPDWPLRLRAEVHQTSPVTTSVPTIIELAGTGWDDWAVALTNSSMTGNRVVAVFTSDDRGADVEVSPDLSAEPFAMLTFAEGLAGSLVSLEPYDDYWEAWWQNVRPTTRREHRLPHFLLRPWLSDAASSAEPVEELEPDYGWQQRLEETATRLNFDADALTVRSWQGTSVERCTASDPMKCLVTITAVVLRDADIPLLVEVTGEGWDSELLVTHLEMMNASENTSGTPEEGPVTPGEPSPADPLGLIGLWEVLEADGEEPGAVLKLDGSRSLVLFRVCGAVWGEWAADHDGLFLADASAWSGECGADPIPGWLTGATAHRPSDGGHVLLGEDGEVLARLVPGEEPTLPPTIAQFEAAPPEITDDTRTAFAEAAPLPEGITAVDGGSLLGRWIPADAPVDSEAHLHLHQDGEWSGSDGCNGLAGRWRAGQAGSLLATGSGSTEIGCENIPVETRLTRAARAGFDAEALVLYDRQGEELGRLRGAGSRGQHAELPTSADDSSHPLAAEARPVDAATASTHRRRFDKVHGDSYAATIDVRSSSGEPSPPYRIEVRDEMISRVTLQLEDGTEEDISDQLARHNVVSVGWIMDQIEGAAASPDATVTAAYDEQGVPRFVRFEDGTSTDLPAVEYLVTDVIALPDAG